MAVATRGGLRKSTLSDDAANWRFHPGRAVTDRPVPFQMLRRPCAPQAWNDPDGAIRSLSERSIGCQPCERYVDRADRRADPRRPDRPHLPAAENLDPGADARAGRVVLSPA